MCRKAFKTWFCEGKANKEKHAKTNTTGSKTKENRVQTTTREMPGAITRYRV
jgi:hypothetical protein